MADCGHGPDDLNSVQMLNGYSYTDLDRSSDLMNFIFSPEPGTSLLALGSYGAAHGKTLTSYTGRVIERALAGAAPTGLCFLDILNISVDVVEDFKGTNGNQMFKSRKCMKRPSFRTLQDTIQKVTVEVCRLRLKLNKQASIVLLRLGPSVKAAWDPIIEYCGNQFGQGGNKDNTYRVIIHDTMPFHPSALYTHFGKDDGSYRREQLLNFFEDMDFLAAKLGCRDDIGGRFELSKLPSNISERSARNANNKNNVRKLLIDHGINPLEALEQMSTYLHIDVCQRPRRSHRVVRTHYRCNTFVATVPMVDAE
jgi:hypothetical protein